MGGFFGIGQSGGEKASTAGINNIFNYALPTAKGSESSGSGDLSTAAGFFKSLLAPGRTQAAQNAAPATNAAIDQSDAARKQEAAQGTGRGGGTASDNREASSAVAKTTDDIINQNLMGGRALASKGLTEIGTSQQDNAAKLLGLGESGQAALYSGAISKEGDQGGAIGKIISSLI